MKKLLRNLIDLLTQWIAIFSRIRRNRIARKDRLNLGCGLAVTPGWLNIDGSFNMVVSKLPAFLIKIIYNISGANKYYSISEYISILKFNDFFLYDLSYGLPFKKETINYIFTSHFLEHLEKLQAIVLLKSCYEVLKPGGVMRISIPDLEYALKCYPKNKTKMLENYFFIDKSEGYHAQHKYMYDFEMLKEILLNVGFKSIERCDFKKGRLPDLDKLDNRPEDSLFIEAEK